MPRHIRYNAHVWAFIIWPRVLLHLKVYVLHYLTPRDQR